MGYYLVLIFLFGVSCGWLSRMFRWFIPAFVFVGSMTMIAIGPAAESSNSEGKWSWIRLLVWSVGFFAGRISERWQFGESDD